MTTNNLSQNIALVPNYNQSAPKHNSVGLSKVRKANYLLQPIDETLNFWIHMEFQFNGEQSEVEVTSYWLTDSAGSEIFLNELDYQNLQFIMSVMNEEFAYQTKLYYSELESVYYSNVKGGYNE